MQSDGWWLYRHRQQAKTKAPLNKQTSKRFAGEFERALKARGAAAKEAAASSR